MVFGIVILLMLGAIAFFHYIQGFFSATISAVLSIISAVVALSYHETIVEGLLAGVAPDWMPALILLGLYAITYVILRTIFDKIVPGGMQLPAIVDKIGGAAMGIVAGIFGLGVVAIAAQQMPFGTSVGGYTRFATVDRTVTVPTLSSGGSVGRAKDAETEDEVDGDTFEADKAKKMIIPVDDILVGTVAHLSDTGSMSADKPFRTVHPDYLTELFGQRLGMQQPAGRTIVNIPDKNQNGVELLAVYEAPKLDGKIVDHELKRIRGTPVKVPAMGPDDIRVVLRVKFNISAADAKDKRIRLSPGAVRLVTKAPDPTGVSDEQQWTNYFPIGTMEPNGLMYAHKIDDFIVIEGAAKKAEGGDSPPEVDFVFQVKRDGFLGPNTDKDPEPQITGGTFLEVKKMARMELAGGDKGKLKRAYKPLTILAVKRKKLDVEGGPPPMEPGKGTAVAGGASAAPAPVGQGGGGGPLGQRLVGNWRGGSALTGGVETFSFLANGDLVHTKGGASTNMRWVAAGPPQGETLTIKTGAAGTDPATGEQRTITFEDENQFSIADSGGNRRFAREGSAAVAQVTPVEQPKTITGPDAAVSRMSGTWIEPDGMTYTFRGDMTYMVVRGNQKGEGKWEVTKVDGEYVDVKLTTKAGKASTQRWRLLGVRENQIVRYDSGEPVEYTRKS